MTKSQVITSVRLADGSVHTGHALCTEHLADRLANHTIAIMDGVNTTQFECDDCKADQAAHER